MFVRKTRTGSFHRIDDKYHLEVKFTDEGGGVEIPQPIIVKSGNGEPIPLEEPRILFRGRDRLALPMLKYYRQLCVADGCTDYQLTSIENMISEFQEFADTATTMKQPGSTRGA
jgi:hypothetical protein